jgi:hypothetical protein
MLVSNRLLQLSVPLDGGVGPSNTTELSNVLYWICDDMFRPRKAILRSIQFTEESEQI